MDRRGENLVRPTLLAMGLHALVIGSFFIAVSPQAKSIVPPQVMVIQATELTFAPSAAAQARQEKQAAETRAREQAEAEKRRQEEAKRQAERKKAEDAKKAAEAKKAEEARQAAEAKKAEARKAEEARRVEEAKKAAEAKQVAESEKATRAKELAEAEKASEAQRLENAKKIEEARARAEAIRERELEEAFKMAEAEARALEELKQKEAEELAVLNALAAEKAAANVLDAMTTRITQAWRRPVAFTGGLEVYLRMSLASNGELVDVRVVKSSGDALFDRSGLTAVQRAAPFHEVKQFDVRTFEEKFRTLTVKFRPED